MGKAFDKDPDARLDYSADWSDWLTTDETISTSLWIIPTGLTKESENNTGTIATVWVSGGEAGQSYRITNKIQTSAGREDKRTITLYCKNR